MDHLFAPEEFRELAERKLALRTMDDPNRTDGELQDLFIYCRFTAGKQRKFSLRKAIDLKAYLDEHFPIEALPDSLPHAEQNPKTMFHQIAQAIQEGKLGSMLMELRVGDYGKTIPFFEQTIRMWEEDADFLRHADREQLTEIKGCGKKVSGLFLQKSRPHLGQKTAVSLDKHVLRWLDSMGVENVPQETPKGPSYERLAGEFRQFADQYGLPVHVLNRRILGHATEPSLWQDVSPPRPGEKPAQYIKRAPYSPEPWVMTGADIERTSLTEPKALARA